MRDDSATDIALRTDLRPGDLGRVVTLHGEVYAREYRFDHTFEAYVAGPLAEFALRAAPRERLWLAERAGRLIGCIAIVAAAPELAQLRWYLVDPSVRGLGLGRTLLRLAIAFCRDNGYRSIILWTVGALQAAAHLYLAEGFRKVEEIPGRRWGVDVIEEKYEMPLALTQHKVQKHIKAWQRCPRAARRQMWSSCATVRSFRTLPVFRVVPGSNNSTCASSSATGRCSTPRGTIRNSPVSSHTCRSRNSMRNRPLTTRNSSSSSS
jgi:N-acetylglutamate synthase-like GNAT family acetyltransferase